MISIIFITFILVALLSLTKNSVSTKNFNWLSWAVIILFSFLIMTIFLYFLYFLYLPFFTIYYDHLTVTYFPYSYLVEEPIGWCLLTSVPGFVFILPSHKGEIDKSKTSSTLNPYYVTGFADGKGYCLVQKLLKCLLVFFIFIFHLLKNLFELVSIDYNAITNSFLFYFSANSFSKLFFSTSSVHN